MKKTKSQLISLLKHHGFLRNQRFLDAFTKVDRRDFVLEEELDYAYENIPLLIGEGQTISQPETVAFMLELLDPTPGERILDIGSGSGRTTALLGRLVGKSGEVIGLERKEALVEFGRTNLSKYKMNQAHIVPADRKLGIHGEVFDKILVSASANKMPKVLLKQLKRGGALVVPVKNSILHVMKLNEQEFSITEYYGFNFVPLIEEEKM